MRRLLFALCLLLTFAVPSIAAEPLRVAVDVPYHPFAFKNDKGELTGFDIEITKALCAEMKRDCVFLEMPFDEILPAIVAGKADISVAGMGETPERSVLVDFSERYFRSHSVFIEKPGNVTETSPAALKAKRVGVQASSVQEQHIKTVYPNSVCVPATRLEDVMDLLKQGKVDVALVDGLPGYEYLKSPAGAELETVGGPVNDGILVGDSSIAVSKKLPEVRKALNQAIQTIRRNGEYAKINRKYFDFNVY